MAVVSKVFLAVGALGLVACAGGALSRGEAQFRDGHYPAAKQVFLSLEARLPGWDDAARAEYGVYRRLTYEALGDNARALEWLRMAKAIGDARPGALSPENANRLRAGLASIEMQQ